MITTPRRTSGFTAVELLITLFVAAAFLIAAYQLFNLVVKDGGSTRAESRAANVAYDYLRKYAASSTTIPCTASTPLSAAPLTVDGLTSVTINIDITCLPNAIASLSKVTATIMYNNPQQKLQYATYVSSSGAK
jgi:Tfp pilus assembly protein PilE